MCWPLIAGLNWVTNRMLSGLGLKQFSGHSMVHSEEELKMLVTASQEAGVIEEQEEQMLHRVFGFGSLTAAHIMIPRTGMVALPADADAARLVESISSSPADVLPVYRTNLDDIVGVVHLRHLVAPLRSAPESLNLMDFVHEIPSVPLRTPAGRLLAQMRRAVTPHAIVMDEYGGTAGIATFDDLMERIAGSAGEREDLKALRMTTLADGSAMVDGLMLVTDLNERFGLHVDERLYTTVGGFVLGRVGQRPSVGDRVVIEGGHARRGPRRCASGVGSSVDVAAGAVSQPGDGECEGERMNTAHIVIGPDGTVLAASGDLPADLVDARLQDCAQLPRRVRDAGQALLQRLPHSPGRVAGEVVPFDDKGSLVHLLAIEACAIRRRATDLRALLTSKLAVVSSQALAAHVTLRIAVADDMPPLVRVDAEKVGWAVTTLVGNALRYVTAGSWQKPGGTIDVQAAFDQATGVTIEVQDDGPGIPADSVARLFRRDGLNVLGSGLALLVMSDVFAGHGGRVDVQSRTDPAAHGTRVRLTFPAT